MGDTTIGRQIGRLELLHSIKKGLLLTGAAPEAIEKFLKVVYICNPKEDPVNVQSEPAHAKLRYSKESQNTAGLQTVTFTVPTGYKILIRKLIISNSNGSTNQDIDYLKIDGFTLWDPENENPATHYRQAPSNAVVLIGNNAGEGMREFTMTDARLCDHAWATRDVEIRITNGGDNYDILELWYEQYELKVDESAASDY